MNPFISEDIEHIFSHTKDLWKKYFLKGSTIFMTGGTGFFGKWLLQSFIYTNEKLNLGGKILVLSRNHEKFLGLYPQFNTPSIKFIKGDVRTFNYPTEEIHYIVHAGTDASVAVNKEQPLLMFDTIVNGTINILEFAAKKKVNAILFISSGAVYGKQPSSLTHVPEEFEGCPDIYRADASYGEGKRVAEMLCNFYYKNFSVQSKIARCFAFAGPYLPLDSHFAFGNFIKNVLDNSPIFIQGDGTPYRSYMYPSDLCIWLWKILFEAPPCRPFNVGSEEEITIGELAKLILSVANKKANIEIAELTRNNNPSRYVPSTKRARKELELSISVNLTDSIRKTILFYNHAN